MSDCPTFTVLAEGVTVKLDSVGGGGPGEVTVRVVVPEIDPSAAFIVEVPAERAVAKPVCVIVAIAWVPLDHVGALHGLLEPSLYVQVAMNWKVDPATMLGLPGVTLRLDRTGEHV